MNGNLNGSARDHDEEDADGEMDIDANEYPVMSADMIAASRRAVARRNNSSAGEFDAHSNGLD